MLGKLVGFVLILISSISICFAKNINLYDQPQKDAKVVGTIDSEVGMVPIFSTKEGDWMKVGDPRNGNVGWVKAADLTTAGTGFSVTQHLINSGKGGPQQYILQFGIPKPLTQEQSAAIVKQIQQQQADIQKNIQILMQEFYSSWPNAFPQAAPQQKQSGK